MRFRCNNCGAKKSWKLGNGQRRCRQCRHDQSPWLAPVCRLTITEWRTLIDLFLVGANSPTLTVKLGKSPGTIIKALQILRTCMAADPPRIFYGTVEVDETYLGGQWKYKRKSVKRNQKLSRRGLGTTKQPVFGILTRQGKVWAVMVDDTEAKNLIPIIENRITKGSKICSDTWRAYTGPATRGYVHRTVKHGQQEYARGTNHINGLEGFFGYLKRQLASRGGIRKERLKYYLAEYVWRYNHRELPVEKQIQRLLNLVAKI